MPYGWVCQQIGRESFEWFLVKGQFNRPLAYYWVDIGRVMRLSKSLTVKCVSANFRGYGIALSTYLTYTFMPFTYPVDRWNLEFAKTINTQHISAYIFEIAGMRLTITLSEICFGTKTKLWSIYICSVFYTSHLLEMQIFWCRLKIMRDMICEVGVSCSIVLWLLIHTA